GLEPDREKLYIAALFHDCGLVPEQDTACRRCAFEVVGARRAYQFSADQGWTEAERRALYETISRHINPHEPLSRSEPEAALLQRGATMDVIGSDWHRIPAGALRRVLADYPREGFGEAIRATMRHDRHPASSRAGLLLSCGFVGMAARNPLDALPAPERARP
ncbi:MAG: HD domain-containing protein, partial [Thiohalorhabdaceae bacterium]